MGDNERLPAGKLVVAGVTSGVGKTTVSLAIMHGLKRRGYAVQPFKVGSDFIDPSYHSLVSGKKSRNLDPWLMGKRGLLESFDEAAEGSEIAVIEGVMGVFDGISGKSDYASTAHVAKMLGASVILVLDASKAARSLAAVAYGIMKFDRRLRIAGVIVNNVASDKHESMVREAFSQKIKAPIVGLIRRDQSLRLEERHLGLVPAAEVEKNKRAQIRRIASRVAEQLDLDSIFELARTKIESPRLKKTVRPRYDRGPKVAKIAVALDESFNFYYPENLELLRQSGAAISFFSPVNDAGLADDIDGMIIGGGFPEVLAEKLEKNRQIALSISELVHDGMPLYAECGGLMYLTRSIEGYADHPGRFKMAGVIDADTAMTKKLTLNYTLAEADATIMGRGKVRGHEFHYSALDNISKDARFAYRLLRGKGVKDSTDGFIIQNCLASYMHLHFAGKPGMAGQFVKSCVAYSRR